MNDAKPNYKTIKTQRPPIDVGFGDKSQVVTLLRGIPDYAKLAVYAHQRGAAAKAAAAAGSAPDTPGPVSPWQLSWDLDTVHGKEAPMAMRCVPPSPSLRRGGVVVCLSRKKEGKVYNTQVRPAANRIILI